MGSSIQGEISALTELGMGASEIARRLGLAEPTVSYHLARLKAEGAEAPPSLDPPPGPAVVLTRERVAALLAKGASKGEVARRLGLARSTVAYHARRLGAPVDERACRRYDWSAVQRHYDAGHSVRDCCAHFGFSRQSWQAAVSRGAIVARPAALPIEELLAEGVPRGRENLKARLLAAGLKQERCERCGLRRWRGEPISLALHHVNGDRHDNRLENLRILCPNCHSQTPNFAGRRRPVG